jgi:hypothetical protein
VISLVAPFLAFLRLWALGLPIRFTTNPFFADSATVVSWNLDPGPLR